MRNFFGLVLVFFFCPLFTNSQEKDVLLQLLKNELKYNMEELQKQENAPYYMNLRVEDNYQVNISSSFGAILASNVNRIRSLVPQIRLGTPELDNFKYNHQGFVGFQGAPASPIYLPIDDDYSDAIREAIWAETIKRYDFAVKVFNQTKTRAATRVQDEDKSPCFSMAPVEKYYEDVLPESKRTINIELWKKRLNELSAEFKMIPELLEGVASIDFQVQRSYFVNTEGTEIVQNRVAGRIMLNASTIADDGMILPLIKDYFAYDPNDLPSNEVILADVKDMIDRLLQLREAPVSDPYAGPAILSGPASGVFFHEIFGHRLEGHRLKTGGQTFKKMVGEQILPSDFQVYSDPTLLSYMGTDMNGSYVYDNEGVKAKKVDNVVNGVLTDFLMSRVPIDGFPVSNGHGRASEGADPVSRQSNLMIETTNPYTEEKLREMLIEEAIKQEKEYGYYFKSVTSGFTYTGEGGSLNSFNVTPLEVYRIYVDGRPDQLVRGVDLIGTPLSMFSNIVAGGNDPNVFTGNCGAESGWVPVTACSPTIFVSKIETQRREQSREIPPIISAPKVSKSVTEEGNVDEVIFKAIEDEMERNKEELALPNEPKPFYISNIIARTRQIHILGVQGGIVQSLVTPWSMEGGVQLVLGDYTFNSEIKWGATAGALLPAEANYDALRRSLWLGTDQMYRTAVATFAQKKSYLSTNPPSSELASVPDMQRLPAVTSIIECDREFIIDKSGLEKLVSELSAVFTEYDEIYGSSVTLGGLDMEVYRLTSEGVKLKQPQGYLRLYVSAQARPSDQQTVPVTNTFSVMVENPEDLPSIEELKKRAHDLAKLLLIERDAPFVDEYYNGPVLIEGEIVGSLFVKELFQSGRITAFKTPLGRSVPMLEDKLGKKVIDERISVIDRPGLQTYNDISLMGNRKIDADGVTPVSERILVDRGVLKDFINGRYPTLKATESTGHSTFTLNQRVQMKVSPSVVHIKVDKGLNQNKMRESLLKEAKKKKLKHAYIIRFEKDSESMHLYQINVKDGKEKMVRSTKMDFPKLEAFEKNLKAISSNEEVMNFLFNESAGSIIYPSSIVVDNMEIFKAIPQTDKAPVLISPLKRKQ